jgi:very-short-patch-repair endonuclease
MSPRPAQQPRGRKQVSRPALFSIEVAPQTDCRNGSIPVRIFSDLVVRQRGVSAVAEIASAQRAIVTARQLTAAGLTRAKRRTLVRRGTLFPLWRGVFAVGTPELQPFAAETAALLHLTHDAVVSHRSAAALWGLLEPADPVQMTVVGRGLRPRDGLQLHRVAQLDSRDVRLRHGLPVTAPARTIIDMAATATPLTLADLLGDCRARRLCTLADIDGALQRVPGRAGTHAVGRLRQSAAGRAFTRSRFERDTRALLVAAELPIPVFNTRVNGYEVDAVWPTQRLILECDGWEHHSSPGAFETDRRRDQDQDSQDHDVVRITWTQLHEEPLRLIALIAAKLARR